MITREKAEIRSLMYAVVAVVLLAFSAAVHAGTKVEIHTNWDALILADHADFTPLQIEMFDDGATDPVNTVNNFLKYVATDSYDNMVFHRWADIVTATERIPFVLQGGGWVVNDPVDYTYNVPDSPGYPFDNMNESNGDPPSDQYYFKNEALDNTEIPNNGAIVNQFDRSNIYGTLAMAKLGGDPDSATSEFFVNRNDNSANLDNQNGGFTVFAQTVEDANSFTGMQIFEWLAQNRGGTVNLSEDKDRNFTDGTLGEPDGNRDPGPFSDVGVFATLDGEGNLDVVAPLIITSIEIIEESTFNPSLNGEYGVQYVGKPDGDVNNDGLLNGFDVDPFVEYLLSGAYHAAADMNKDGLVNGFDVDPFVAALLGGGAAPESIEVPEPATMVLLGVGLVAMRRRRRA